MNLLVLGGTAWLGRELARQAVARGFDVTCAARGSAPIPDGAAFVRIDRDLDDGLRPVTGQTWDAVIDLTRQPGHARGAVRDLTTGHHLLISSGSVYARFDRPEQHEGAELLSALTGDTLTDMSFYGAAKVAREQAVTAAPGSWTVIRSGLIGGAGDTSGRSGYYPWRFAHPTGADVLVPPDLTFPVAMIDVEDLASWVLDCVERRTVGIYNATGPTTTLQRVLDISRSVSGSPAQARAVPGDVLTRAGVGAWMGTPSLPLWVDDPSWRWFATMDTTAARSQGLTTRPLEMTLTAALTYENNRDEPRAPASPTRKSKICVSGST